mmetsp:Transcript_13918/g.21221  ORF Transcript_13918/g.21221 Transcript_13918/m.21221 type:complete len:533 (-) Transcript_13918:185-1783(-)
MLSLQGNRGRKKRSNLWLWLKCFTGLAVPYPLFVAIFLLRSNSFSTRNDRSFVNAFQAPLVYRSIAKYSPSRRKYCALPKRLPVHHRGQTIFTRLFDSERSEADLRLSSQLASSINGLKLESLRVENQTLTLNDLEETTTSTTNIEVPLPTANGGFTHTTASKAKISAANKGKTPWNKGKSRSEETRARIAAGVRAKNRERFLQKLQDLGLTEEQYEQQKKEERRRKDAERRARRTEKGGYRPTDATKKKISKILKKKWADGEMPKRKIDKSKVRRGFKHSKETRDKISASLRKRWAEDESYRENMVVKTTKVNSSADTRKKISETLKAKWQDPEFRNAMLSKMSTREGGGTTKRGVSYRRKISEAMKAKWQDEAYREKTLSSIRKRAEKLAKLRPPKPAKKPKTKTQTLQLAKVAKARSPRKRRVARKTPKEIGVNGELLPDQAKKRKKVKRKTFKSSSSGRAKRKKKSRIPKEPDGSINRLRDERRDLYDLLYGDEDSSVSRPPVSGIAAMLDLEDENLDNFDPYGLDDF